MSEQALSIGPLQRLPQVDAASASQTPVPPYGSRWSLFVSLVCACILMSALGSILWFSVTVPKLQRFEEPDRALDLMVSRMLEAQDSLSGSPEWQQWLAEWTMGNKDEAYTQGIRWYRELVETTDDPLSKLRLVILLGESGREAEALAEAKEWHDHDVSAGLFEQLTVAAYGSQPLDRIQELELQAALAETVPSGWFYNQLSARLARRGGHQGRLATIEQQSAGNTDRIQQWIRPVIVTEMICLMIGSVMLLGIVRLRGQRVDILRVHVPGVPPPWSGSTAVAVILRGGALGAITTLAFLSMPAFEQSSASALVIPLANLPLLILAYVQLLKPAGLTFGNGFGLRIKSGNYGRLACIIVSVIAAGLWGEWVLGKAADVLNLTNHWTEWFDPNLVWASPSQLTVSVLEYVIFAPIFEEIAFRGLLYATLRRRLAFFPAAIISTSIFALAHGYSLIGFISVFWSGFLWAWIYERTGSLIPGMVAHAMNNLLVCLTVMALLR
ncbi:MAG: CPBP family intramembrane metalloprotease [Nitrospira sp.]|nr:CPBP family intramembrane metalloprotease [Nitrospira sp.]MDH4371279.1 CPBP family intramembrane metalloprotease [Nitrospira sp.]MDH5347888.1 CPBP family intramembrane metalloprotease [Nitrospira sp.]MDH5498788.1 CPBP family intramembrane metalloprotease [Nitrospira sp.]